MFRFPCQALIPYFSRTFQYYPLVHTPILFSSCLPTIFLYIFFYLPYMFCNQGFESQHGQGNYSLKTSRLAPGSTQPPIQWVQRVVSQGKGSRHEAHNSPTCSVEFYEWSFTSISSTCLHGVCRNNFMFLTCSMHLIMHNLITIIICGEDYKL
jgi:hypothetical protein